MPFRATTFQILIGLFFLVLRSSWAATPMDLYNALVAGTNEAGFADGAFNQARFTAPSGLAFDEQGDRLFVADQKGDRIRVIYLKDKDRVETLSGTGKAGKQDGPLSTATFNLPTRLAWMPPDRLAVYEQGNHDIRSIDLTNKTVTTLQKVVNGAPETLSVGLLWSLVYRREDHCLYFSDPDAGIVERLELSTQRATTLLSNNPSAPNPKALCLYQGQVCVADQKLPGVYRVDGLGDTSTGQAAVTLEKIGNGYLVHEMVESDGTLYALQVSANPLVRIGMVSQPVSLASPWGFMLPEDQPNVIEPLISMDLSVPVGMASTPKEPRKLYLSRPRPTVNSVISVKDYRFDKDWKARSWQNLDNSLTTVTDFDYPKAKSEGTFRILMIGNSRMVSGDTPGLNHSNVSGDYQVQDSLRSFTLPKELELLMNTQVTLQSAQTHFEVLTLGQPGGYPYLYAHYSVPKIVEKYGIDLVLMMETSLDEINYMDYFLRPTGKGDVPTKDADMEYLLKPYPGRIGPGITRLFYERCDQLKLIRKDSSTQWSFPEFEEILDSNDPILLDNLVEMIARPLRKLSNELKPSPKNPGIYARTAIFFTPALGKVEGPRKFWNLVAEKSGIPLLDITDDYRALEPSYFPLCDAYASQHYTAYGNFLLAQILTHELVEQKWVPFEKAPKAP